MRNPASLSLKFAGELSVQAAKAYAPLKIVNALPAYAEEVRSCFIVKTPELHPPTALASLAVKVLPEDRLAQKTVVFSAFTVAAIEDAEATLEPPEQPGPRALPLPVDPRIPAPLDNRLIDNRSLERCQAMQVPVKSRLALLQTQANAERDLLPPQMPEKYAQRKSAPELSAEETDLSPISPTELKAAVQFRHDRRNDFPDAGHW